MTELNKTKPSAARRGWGVVQWIVSIFLLLIALIFATGSDALNAPGAPVAGYYASVGVLALVAVSLIPPIFFRLPKAGKSLPRWMKLKASWKAAEAFSATPFPTS